MQSDPGASLTSRSVGVQILCSTSTSISTDTDTDTHTHTHTHMSLFWTRVSTKPTTTVLVAEGDESEFPAFTPVSVQADMRRSRGSRGCCACLCPGSEEPQLVSTGRAGTKKRKSRRSHGCMSAEWSAQSCFWAPVDTTTVLN